MIGAGIFITVKVISGYLPNSGITILMYLVVGLYTLAGSLCFAELGTFLGGLRFVHNLQ